MRRKPCSVNWPVGQSFLKPMFEMKIMFLNKKRQKPISQNSKQIKNCDKELIILGNHLYTCLREREREPLRIKSRFEKKKLVYLSYLLVI